MLWHLYLRNGIAYVPTLARAEAGFHTDIEPIHAVPAADKEALQHAIQQVMSSGNPRVPTPPRTAPSPLLKYAGVKSWPKFEKNALHWAILGKGGVYQIKPGRKAKPRGWEDDVEKIETFPPGTTADEVIKRLIVLVQTALSKTTPG